MSSTNHKAISAVLTVLVVVGLVFSGPVTALSLHLLSDDDSVDEGADFYADAILDVHDTDFLLAESVLNITVSSAQSASTSCSFRLSGETIGSCGSLSVELTSYNLASAVLGYGVVYGYGYDGIGFYDAEQYGYGYTYVPTYGSDTFVAQPSSGELVYRIRWRAPSVSADTDYRMSFSVHMGDVVFSSQELVVRVVDTSSDDGGSSSGSPSSDSRSREPLRPDPVQSSVEYNPTHTKYYSSLEANMSVAYSFLQEGISVRGLEFVLIESRENVYLLTSTRITPPRDWVSEMHADLYRRVYSFTEFEHFGKLDDNLAFVSVNFSVSKEWFDTEIIRAGSIRVYELVNGTWHMRLASLNAQDDNYYYFASELEGLGVIALTAQSLLMRGSGVQHLEGEVEVGPDDFEPRNETVLEDDVEEVPGDAVLPPIVFIIVGVIILGGALSMIVYHTHVKKL